MMQDLVPKGNPLYGIQCLQHSQNCEYALIDKITISAPISIFNMDVIANIDHPAFSLLRYGNYLSIAVSGEAIIPTLPMYLSLLPTLRYLLGMGAFKPNVSNMLYVYLAYCGPYYIPPGFKDGFLSTLDQLGFTFSALELAFDMVGYSSPISIEDETKFRQIKGTYYSTDYHRSPSGNQASMLCIYDKGKLLTEESDNQVFLPPGARYIRVEFRIGGWNGKRWLHISDLQYNMQSYIETYGEKIRRKTDKLVGGAISIIGPYVPEQLYDLLPTPRWTPATPVFSY